MASTLYGARRSGGRPVALIATIGLHVAGVALLMSAGGFQYIAEKTPRLLNIIVNDPQPVEPPERIELAPTRLNVESAFAPPMPAPLFLADETPASDSAITVTPPEVTGPPTGPVVVAPPAPVSTPLSWTARRSPDDLYPPASIRMAEEGSATVRVCVGANGRISGAPQVVESSGHPRLDQAAIQWTREALTYRPATEDGRPVEACKGFKVTFDLK